MSPRGKQGLGGSGFRNLTTGQQSPGGQALRAFRAASGARGMGRPARPTLHAGQAGDLAGSRRLRRYMAADWRCVRSAARRAWCPLEACTSSSADNHGQHCRSSIVWRPARLAEFGPKLRPGREGHLRGSAASASPPTLTGSVLPRPRRRVGAVGAARYHSCSQTTASKARRPY